MIVLCPGAWQHVTEKRTRFGIQRGFPNLVFLLYTVDNVLLVFGMQFVSGSCQERLEFSLAVSIFITVSVCLETVNDTLHPAKLMP